MSKGNIELIDIKQFDWIKKVDYIGNNDLIDCIIYCNVWPHKRICTIKTFPMVKLRYYYYIKINNYYFCIKGSLKRFDCMIKSIKKEIIILFTDGL